MWQIVFQCHFIMMRMNDGLIERKSKTKTPSAVTDQIASGKEHFKNKFLSFIWNTGTVITDTDLSCFFLLDCCDSDVRAWRSIFDCVVHQIDKYLHDESRIHPHQQRLIATIHSNMMFCRSSVDMPERFRYNIVYDLIRKMQFDAAVRDFCNRK